MKLDKKIKVQTKKFDSVFNNFKKIDFCKIDVQGEDPNVLRGMKKHLAKKKIRLVKIEIIFISLYINVEPNFYNILEFMKKTSIYLYLYQK